MSGDTARTQYSGKGGVMAKKTHFTDDKGNGLCGIRPRSRGKGTTLKQKVTCSICKRKLGIQPWKAKAN